MRASACIRVSGGNPAPDSWMHAGIRNHISIPSLPIRWTDREMTHRPPASEGTQSMEFTWNSSHFAFDFPAADEWRLLFPRFPGPRDLVPSGDKSTPYFRSGQVDPIEYSIRTSP